jgi:hypothetical protein
MTAPLPSRALLSRAILPLAILGGIAAAAFLLAEDPARGAPAALSLLLGAGLGVLFQRALEDPTNGAVVIDDPDPVTRLHRCSPTAAEW